MFTTLPECVMRFSKLTSSPFAAGTGDAKVKVIDARSAQARMKKAKRDMVFRFWELDRVAQWKEL